MSRFIMCRCSWGSALRCGVLGLAMGLVAGSLAAAAPAGNGAALAAQPPAEYRLGGGDLVKIQVYQNPDLSLDARLSDTGSISYPLLGTVKLGGLTVQEAERFLAEGLRKGDFVKSPQVTILLETFRGSQVSVLGQVQRPGRYVLDRGNTRLSDILAQAGGVAPSVGSDTITVIGERNGKPFRKQVDLPQIFSSESRPDDMVLQGDDVIFVDRAPVYFIYGQVQRPGMMRLERGMTLLQGLAGGGGLTLRGTERGIVVHRRNASGQTEVLEPKMDDPLRDGDVIYVRESLF